MVAIIQAHRTDPKLPWHIAGMVSGERKVGKELLLHQKWEGTLHMDAPEERDKFDRYVGAPRRTKEQDAMAQRRKESGL